MRQPTLAEEGVELYRKPIRRGKFLEEMDQVIPWSAPCGVIKPFYVEGKGASRPKDVMGRMLKIDTLQYVFDLSDRAVEGAMFESQALRCVEGIDLGGALVPGEVSICKFRHLLAAHNPGAEVLSLIDK